MKSETELDRLISVADACAIKAAIARIRYNKRPSYFLFLSAIRGSLMASRAWRKVFEFADRNKGSEAL